MSSKKRLDKEETEDAIIRNTGKITNLALTGIEMRGHTRGDIYGSNMALTSDVK